MKSKYKLFKLFDIDVYAHFSWIILVGLLSFAYSGYYSTFHPDSTFIVRFSVSISCIVGLYTSLLIHEYCHCFVARYYDIKTEFIALSMFGAIAFFEKSADTAKKEFEISFAGPIISLILYAMLYCILFSYGKINLEFVGPVIFILYNLKKINLMIALVNLLPFYPLDGGRMLHSGFWLLLKNKMQSIKISTNITKIFALSLTFMALLAIFDLHIIFPHVGWSMWIYYSILGWILYLYGWSESDSLNSLKQFKD